MDPPDAGSADRSRKPYDIRVRSFEFALAVLDITGALPGTPEANVARTQLARASTAIGANIEEADGAVTKPDKRKSLVHARKEARETRYWLRIVERKWASPAQVGAALREINEILNILSAIIDKLG